MTSTESRYVTSFDGARIAYRVFGAGEPTVLISNGIGCNQAFMEPLIQYALTAADQLLDPRPYVAAVLGEGR